MSPAIPLSVVLPLADHRDLAVRSAETWARQTLASDCYEIVAVDGGSDRRLGAEVRRRLRARDRLLERPGGSEIELYEAGARAASGTTLLFTESHCLPEADAAEALLRHLHETGGVAATLAAGHLVRGRLAALEAAVGDRALERSGPERWWVVASLRGLAVRRSVFLEIGGFQTRLERFAETVLAVELERRGYRATRAPTARVHHGDCSRPRELEQALLTLGRGRARLLAEGLPEELLPWLAGLDGVSRADIDARAARGLCRSALSCLFDRGSAGGGLAPSALAALRALAPVALAGPSGATVAGRTRARLALWRCALGIDPFPRRLRVFEAAWKTLAQCGEIEVQAARALSPLAPAHPPVDLLPGEMAADALVGFHGREHDGEGSFRWSGPFGLARLSLPRGSYRITACLMRPPGDGEVGIFWNGERLRLEGGDTLRGRVDVRGEAEQHLTLLATPFAPRSVGLEDDRTLGVAVRRLSFTPC